MTWYSMTIILHLQFGAMVINGLTCWCTTSFSIMFSTMANHITADRGRECQNAKRCFFFSAREWRRNMLDNLVAVRRVAQLALFTANYKLMDYNGLSKVCTRELIYVGRAHPSYIQVTLERSDFRTDFRTRQKNKAFSLNHIPRRTLRHQTKIAYIVALQSHQGATSTLPVVAKHERGTRNFVYLQVWCPLVTYSLLY